MPQKANKDHYQVEPTAWLIEPQSDKLHASDQKIERFTLIDIDRPKKVAKYLTLDSPGMRRGQSLKLLVCGGCGY